MVRVGVEKEFLIHDKFGNPQRRFQELALGRSYFHQEHDMSQFEVVSEPHADLSKLRLELEERIEFAREQADEHELLLSEIPWAPYRRPQMGQYQADHVHVERRTPESKLKFTNFISHILPELLAATLTPSQFVGSGVKMGIRHNGSNANISPPPEVSIQEIEAGKLATRDVVKSRHFDVTPFTSPNGDGSPKNTVEIRFPDAMPLKKTLAFVHLVQAFGEFADHHKVRPINIGSERAAVVESGLNATLPSNTVRRNLTGLEDSRSAKEWLQAIIEALGDTLDQGLVAELFAPSKGAFPDAPKSWHDARIAALGELKGHGDYDSWVAAWTVLGEDAIPDSDGNGPDVTAAKRMDQLASVGNIGQEFAELRDRFLAEEWIGPRAQMLIHAHRAGLHGKLLHHQFGGALDPDYPLAVVEAFGRYGQPLPGDYLRNIRLRSLRDPEAILALHEAGQEVEWEAVDLDRLPAALRLRYLDAFGPAIC